MKEVIIGALAVIAIFLLIALIFGFPTMWLWNSLMPDIFGLPRINFLQAVGLIILSQVFFNSGKSSSKD